jgi:hypothetical protein
MQPVRVGLLGKQQGPMTVARSFLLLSAGLVTGGLAGATLSDGSLDWRQFLTTRLFADRSAGPAIVAAPLPPPAALPQPAAPAPRAAAEPVPETVVVSLPNSAAPIPLRTRPFGGAQLSLAQELQSELRRVGCYGGPVDGAWTPLSQRAMQAFVDGVNAHLPVAEPDYALLALLRSSRNPVCARPCLPDQRGVADSACPAAKSVPETTPAALTRSTIAADPAPANPRAPAPIAAGPGAAPGVAPSVLPAPPPRQRAAQKKSSPGGFGPDIFNTLFKTFN